VLSDTARLEAGSTGGAQVIELGAGSADTKVTEDHGPAEVFAFSDAQTTTEAEVDAEPAPAPEPEEPEEYDPITAAINAYGLPQRRPGASGAGTGTSVQSMGGGFFERVEPDEAEKADAQLGAALLVGEDDVVDAVLAEDEHDAEVHPFAVVSDAREEEERAPIALGPADREAEADETEQVESDEHVAEVLEAEVAEPEVEEAVAEETEAVAEETEETEHVAEVEETVAEVAEPEVEEAVAELADEPVEEDSSDHLAPVLATLPLNPSVPLDVTAEKEAAEHTNGNGNGQENGHAAANGFARIGRAASMSSGPLDRGAPTPASMEDDETPIFRSLRSNWLTADTGERPWADTEVDAGWDAADRVEATPPTRRPEAGLPMRRPGNRLIPGGLSTPEPSHTVRDPDAIRARLAAHAAGVSRGRRSASAAETMTAHDPGTTTQEVDPA
jgi:hypothetical protein